MGVFYYSAPFFSSSPPRAFFEKLFKVNYENAHSKALESGRTWEP